MDSQVELAHQSMIFTKLSQIADSLIAYETCPAPPEQLLTWIGGTLDRLQEEGISDGATAQRRMYEAYREWIDQFAESQPK
ncbi:hypothetical protein [Pseudomonas sp. HY13-MNA-CIBAN-0226]|uniref:hypothetical protein n=1 Tax=Pseudomonas sp. HY13-MNA-CIBAN-0226 TaxID=3140473 RepID=UPI00333320C0